MITSGLLTFKSENSVTETSNRLIALFKEKDITLFAHINHSAGASKIYIDLRPTEVLIFGNPATGSPLMQDTQTIGIDLPQKALIWQDEDGAVWLAFNDPDYLKERHNLSDNQALLDNLSNAFKQFAQHATSKTN